jgi:hypothetical protein
MFSHKQSMAATDWVAMSILLVLLSAGYCNQCRVQRVVRGFFPLVYKQLTGTLRKWVPLFLDCKLNCRVQLKCDDTRWRAGGEVKGKLAKGVGSQYSHTTSERGVSSITTAVAHTSAASSRLNWRPHQLNGLVRFAERRNLVSACVPSNFKRSLAQPARAKFTEDVTF